MSDDATLRTILKNDQSLTEVNEIFTPICTPICTAFKLMRMNGLPEENAGYVTQAYAEMVIDRHFGVTSLDISAYLEDGE